MTNGQSNKLDMYLVVQDFYEDNQATIDLVLARANAFGQLGTNISAINTAIGGQSSNTTGVAQDKAALRDTLDNIAAVTLASAKAWALANNNNTLAAEFAYPISEIQAVKDDTMQGFCNHRIGLINDNIATMADYGIDAAAVQAWQDALAAYVAMLESPREAINTRHLHTEALKTLFSNTGKLFKNQLDPLMMVFKLSDPEFYSAYKQARIIIDRGGSGSNTVPANTIRISGTTSSVDTEEAIEATITLTPNDGGDPVVTTTDENGVFEMEFTDVETGTTFGGTLEAAAVGFESSSTPIEVEAGNSYVFDFTLTPVVEP